MAWRECTNCGMKQAPYEPRKRRGDHLLCKGCAAKPVTALKKVADEEGTPGADLESDFVDAPSPLIQQHQTAVGTNELGHPINHLGHPTFAPVDPDTEMWPENDDLGNSTAIHPLAHALPVSLWQRHALHRKALGHPAPHRYKGKRDPLHKAAHVDPHASHSVDSGHSHTPYVTPIANTMGPMVQHLQSHHEDIDPMVMVDAAGDHQKMKKVHLDAHVSGDDDHGSPAGSTPHQHLHSSPVDDPEIPEWEKELLGNANYAPHWGYPHKIKDHLSTSHHIEDENISGSDMFNHDYHDDLHEHEATHTHDPKPDAQPFMPEVPESSLAQHKAHLVIGHGHNTHDVGYMSLGAAKQAHSDAHDAMGNTADHQHEDDDQPYKYGAGEDAQAQAHLTDDHGKSVLDHGHAHGVEMHKFIHKTQHNDYTQPHWHANQDDHFGTTPTPTDKPGGATYDAMVEHMKQSGSHGGNYYSGWENGESMDSMKNAHQSWHNNYGPHDHNHEDLSDPLDAGSTEQLQQAEQGKAQHKHHEDMSPDEFTEHMQGPGHEWSAASTLSSHDENGLSQHDTDHEANDADDHHTHAPKGEEAVQPTPKTKKPNANPQFGDKPGYEPEMYAWDTPKHEHPKNKSEVIQHLMDNHPEVDSQDYENSEFKNDGYLKGWHSHLHSGKEHEISPADMHTHVDDDSSKTPRPNDNVFSHLVTHHGYSEDQAKAMRHVDAVAHHEHTHKSGDDEEIGHQHDYAGAPPSEPQSWVVNSHHAGENYEHYVYHGTGNTYYCPSCNSEPGTRKDDCPDCGHAAKPATATENQKERGEWGRYGDNDWNCHIAPHFSTLYGQAKNFGHRIIAAMIKGRKPKYYDNLNHFAHDSYDRLHALGELKDNGEFLGNHVTNEYNRCCSHRLAEYAQGRHRTDGKYGLRRVRDSLRADGYDHILARNHADGPHGAINVFPLSPKQVHIHDEDHEPSSSSVRSDSSGFRPPAGWSRETSMHDNDAQRPPDFMMSTDPRLGEHRHHEDMTADQFRNHTEEHHSERMAKNEEGVAKHEAEHASGTNVHRHGNPLPKSAPEHPDDYGDPDMGERGHGGFSSSSDDDEDNDQYCSNCETDSHGHYDDHCGSCEEYTGDGDCSCAYCPACEETNSHGNEPGDYHKYCEHCDHEGVEGGWTDHDEDEHKDEYDEHPNKFQDQDYCPHCESHDKENRDQDNCQSCGATLPDYEKVNAPGDKGNYPTPGGGTKQWDHSTHMWGHLTHDHGFDMSGETTDPESMAAKHKAAHTGQIKHWGYPNAHKNDMTPGDIVHDPEHGHDQFPQTPKWEGLSKDEKIAHMGQHHAQHAVNLNDIDEDVLDSKHQQGHGYQYADQRTPHQHSDDGTAAPHQEHAPEGIGTHMAMFHGMQTKHTKNFTDDQLHLMHNEHHAMGGSANEWHHEHTPEGVQLTGKHMEPPKDAATQIAAVQHMHEHHSEMNAIPSLNMPMSSIESTHLTHHKTGPLAAHTHPVSEGPHPDEDAYGHLKTQHNWSDEQVENHKVNYGDYVQSAHTNEHSHTMNEGAAEHHHFGTPTEPVKAIPKAFSPPNSPWTTYEPHQQHMKDHHGFEAPGNQGGSFYKDLHHSMHTHPEVGEELGLAEGHDHHEHTSSGGLTQPNTVHNHMGSDPYSLAMHMKDYHPDEYTKAGAEGFNYNSSGHGEAMQKANELHEQHHADASDYLHTHKPDPNMPLHPDKPHLNDALAKHMGEHHGYTKDESGAFEDHDSMMAKHAEAHGGEHNYSGGLSYNYDDPKTVQSQQHQHASTALKTLHGTDIVDGKPTKQINPKTDFDNTSAFANHINTEHAAQMKGSNLSHYAHPDELLSKHMELHSHEGEDGSNHVHKSLTPLTDKIDGDDDAQEQKTKDIAHFEDHHGLVQHNLADKAPSYVKMLHQHEHANAQGVGPGGDDAKTTLPVKHTHGDQGTDSISYPPAVPHNNVHNAHDLAHHLEDHHDTPGLHGSDQATLLLAHEGAHGLMQGNAAKGQEEHLHTLMYPHGHEKAKAPQTTSALAHHVSTVHYDSTTGKTQEQIAADHEVSHLGGTSHQHTSDEMSALHKAAPTVMPPKAEKPDMDSYELESHLKVHHGMDYNHQSNAGLGGEANKTFHDAEHAKGSFGHVHQHTSQTSNGMQPYPDNPAPPVEPGEKEITHLHDEHGMHADSAGEASTMHTLLHQGHQTDHQHQPDPLPTTHHPSQMGHVNMANHLNSGHGFTTATLGEADLAQMNHLHDQSHKDTASLPFHGHNEHESPMKSAKEFDTTTMHSQVASHMTKDHGLIAYDAQGNHKGQQALMDEHAAHHAEHDGKSGLWHVHAPPKQVGHFVKTDTDAAKQHLVNHHGASVYDGMSPSEMQSEHEYHHNYQSADQIVHHTHSNPPPENHGDMSHDQLVNHLNTTHGTPSLKGDMGTDYYQHVHQTGHGDKIPNTPHYPPTGEHHHPDIAPKPPVTSNHPDVHEGNVDHHLDTAHGTIVTEGGEASIEEHNGQHAGGQADHFHPSKVSPPAPHNNSQIAIPGKTGEPTHPHVEDHQVHTHLNETHKYAVDADSTPGQAQQKHEQLHFKPIDKFDQHGHFAPAKQAESEHDHPHGPTVMPVAHNGAVNHHLVNVHKVEKEHSQLDDGDDAHDLHATLHANPEDEHDSGHTHSNVPVGPQGDGLHSHSALTSMVEFFEREWVVD